MASTKSVAGRVLLPDNVQPLRYVIRLEPDLVRFNFDGAEEVLLEIKEATDEIVFHARELSLNHDDIVLTPSGTDSEMKPTNVNYYIEDNTVTLKFKEMLPVGQGTLKITFVGCLNDKMAGFYRSGYKDLQGNEKVMASTQFESLDARRAFCCWDEPARKAIFAVTLVVDTGLTALSNMPEKSRKVVQVGKKVEVVFMDTPLMSTYLLAFVVGEFDFIQAQTDHGVAVRVYTPPGRASHGEFALKVATQSLDGYDDYFSISYPLPKLDMIAIPEFAAGAMENWGLVTYREVDLLIATGASRNQLQRVAITVAHELAHQWFGNLVTMTWWDDLWLNEGFASWCENDTVAKIFPDFSIWDQFVSDTQTAALKLDAMRSSHPIQVPIGRAQEVEEVFDAISYCKGASVIKMMHAFLGPEAFRTGLQQYFRKHKYGNTETIDLWTAWEDASGKPVASLMASWTEQMGFPLISVKELGDTEIEIEQRWFLSDGSEVQGDEEKLWTIPIFFASGKDKAAPSLVLMEVKTHRLSINPTHAIVLNAARHVPMRVLYTPALYERLAASIKEGSLSTVDRAGLVLDAFAMAKAGCLGSDSVFKLLTAFREETDYVVLDAISQTLLGFNNIFMAGASEVVYQKFLGFAGKLTQTAFERIGWDARVVDGHLDGLSRQCLLTLQGKFSNDEVVIKEARRRFEDYLNGNIESLPDEIKVPVFQLILKTGGTKEYTDIKSLHNKATNTVEKLHVLNAIGYAADISKKMEVLEWAISGDIKLQDFFYAFGSVSSSSKAAVELAWDFFKANFTKIKHFIGSANASIMDAMIQYSTRGLCTVSAAEDIEKFFVENKLPMNQRTINQVLEGIRTNASFLEKVLNTPANDAAFWDNL